MLKKSIELIICLCCFVYLLAFAVNAECEHNFELLESRKNLVYLPDGFHSFRCINECGSTGTVEFGPGTKEKCNLKLAFEKLPNCITEGKQIYFCTVCFTNIEKTIGKTNHNYKKTVKLPTCFNQGYDLYKCTVCDKSYKENLRETVSHISDGGLVKVLPTYEKNGVLVSSCKICGAKLEIKVLEKLSRFGEKEQPPEKIKNLKIKSVSANSVKLSWDGADRAVKYKISYYADKKIRKNLFTENTSVTVKNLSQSKKYSFKIIAVGNDTESIESTITVCTKPKRAELVSVKSLEKSEATLKWKKISGVSGYEISYATESFRKENTVKTIYVSNKNKKTIKKLESGKIYRFKIRACKLYGSKKIFGAYSKIRSLKIK